jgi:hypothetical protein
MKELEKIEDIKNNLSIGNNLKASETFVLLEFLNFNKNKDFY